MTFDLQGEGGGMLWREKKGLNQEKKHANEDETDITGKPQVEVAVK